MREREKNQEKPLYPLTP